MKKLIAFILAFLCVTFSAFGAYKYDNYVRDAFENKIISGNESGDFESEKIASRAEFIMMTSKFFDLKPGYMIYSDVKETDWFYDTMTQAGANGILSGYPDGTARPYAPITCQEAISIIGRYYKMTDNGVFGEGVSEYAQPYYNYAYKNKLFVEMTPEHTMPGHYMTKGELLVLLYKYHNENLSKIRFLSGYPRTASKGSFNNITLAIKTNRPCDVYYGIYKAGEKNFDTEKLLCRVPYANTEVTVSVLGNINEKYDIYLRAVAKTGETSRLSVLKAITPFAFTKGQGTENNPYIIYTEKQLDQIRQRPDLSYKLENDIKITEPWESIDGFTGVLDGNGHSVSGIEISGEGENKGLFSEIYGGTVKNLTVSADISGKRNIGIIAGYIKDGVIENCVVDGFVSAKTNCVGGICGVNQGIVKNCVAVMYSTASSSYAGGICGQNFGTVSGCLVATEIVASDMYAGGIAGTNQGGKIKGCVFAGKSIYDTMTHSSGRITTNRSEGIVTNSYCFSGVATNAEYTASDKNTSTGMNVPLTKLEGMDFYITEVGWDKNDWEIPQNGFIFPCPKGVSPPEPEMGKMMCMPQLIRTEEELRSIDKNPRGHYALANDIHLERSWKSLCKLEGFSGSLDGRGYAIYNMRLNDQDGLFSNISAGMVRNLNIRDAVSKPESDGAILSGCNYGYIENCTISGKIETQKAGAISLVTLENYGEIKNCDVSGEMISHNNNAVIGGISANNSGRIINCYYNGSVTATGDNAVIGGISGCDDGGYIFENHSNVKIVSKNNEAYLGGVCGMAIGTQIYKNSSSGSFSSDCEDYSYLGGICGSLQNSLIYNCYSSCEIFADSQPGYIGGVAGCASASNVQSSYSVGNLFSLGIEDVYTGGICGFAEESFIMQNVALNPVINARVNVGAVFGGYTISEVEDNYSIDKMLINSQHIESREGNCKIKSEKTLKSLNFFFKPVAQGGLLGWGNVLHGEEIWTSPGNKYPYPVLFGVKMQDGIKIPTYK